MEKELREIRIKCVLPNNSTDSSSHSPSASNNQSVSSASLYGSTDNSNYPLQSMKTTLVSILYQLIAPGS
jgi:hypothetical protein